MAIGIIESSQETSPEKKEMFKLFWIGSLAERFDVALSFIIKILKQKRETGDIAPKSHGGGNPARLRSEQYPLIAELIEAKNDMTIAELCAEFQQRLQLKVSRSTMGRAVQKLQLQRKKNFSGN